MSAAGCDESAMGNTGRTSKFVLIVVTVVTLAGLVLRAYDLGHPFWLDELHTSWCASGPWDEVAFRASEGNQPPPYFWLAWLITAGKGGGEMLLRLPSLLAGMLLIPASYWVGFRLSGYRLAGCLAAALVAFDPWFINFSQEARCYALVQLLAVLNVAAFVAATRDATLGRRAVFIAVTLLLFYLHYTSLLLLSGELAWYVVCRRWRLPRTTPVSLEGSHPGVRRYSPLTLCCDLVLIVLLTLPAWADLQSIYLRRGDWRAFVPKFGLRSLFDIFRWPQLVVPGLIAVCLGWIGKRCLNRSLGREAPSRTDTSAWLSTRSCGVLLACWFFVPLLLVWTANHLDFLPLFMTRYLGVIAAVPALLAGWLCCLPTIRWLRWGAAAATLLVAFVEFNLAGIFEEYGRFSERRTPDWPAAIAWIEAQEQAAAVEPVQFDEKKGPAPLPVLYWAGLIEGGNHARAAIDPRFREYLTFPVRGYYRLLPPRIVEPILNRPGAWSPALVTAEQLNLLRTHGGGWLIYAGRVEYSAAIANHTQRSLSPTAPSPPLVRSFSGITVYRLVP